MATNISERPGTKAKVKFVRMSASKARAVLGLVRGKKVTEAIQTLQLTERGAAIPVAKLLDSAVANAEHNEDIPVEELYISECYADKAATIKRFRPRARGRASHIQKQTCHITIEVSRYTDEELDRLKDSASKKAESSKNSKKKVKKKSTSRSERVAKSKKSDQPVVEETESSEISTESIEAAEEVTETSSKEDQTEAVSEESSIESDTEEETK